MADNFGTVQNGRATVGGRFYAVPATDVDANTVFMPNYSASPLFGIPEYPVKSGALGAFATDGVFVFDKPENWVDSVGQAVYWNPTSAIAGTFSATPASGAVLVGYQITANIPTNKLGIFLARPIALES